MKNLRKVTTFILALAMVLSLAVTGLAAETPVTTYTLTINNEVDGHTYEAYQIFKGDLATVDGKEILSNIVWGDSIDGDALLALLNGEDGIDALKGATDAASLAVKLSSVTSDSATIDAFAELVGECLVSVSGTSTDKGDYYEISNLHAGYYLVKDQNDTLDEKYDAYTKYIIHVLKDANVTPKSSVPKVDKKINDTVDGTFEEKEDFDIGDTAYYKWEGTLPSNLDAYDTYYYEFVDQLSAGLAFVRFEQIYIEGHDGNRIKVFLDLHDADETNNTIPTGITSDVSANKRDVTLTFADLLRMYDNLMPTHKIVVKYSALITRDAEMATAIPNKVKINFSNNPNGEGDGDFGTTPEDEAYAFTFSITVDKYDADNTDKKLADAEFVLYYERDESGTTVKYYAKVITEEMIEAGDVINDKQVTNADLGVVYAWTTDKAQASILDTDINGSLTVEGLDSGIFYLEETKAPAGYNLMETPVQINIIPTYSADGSSVTVSYEVDSIAQSSSTVGVRNSSGSTLPSTGGIGTTIFYILGGLMVLGATVVLVTKKRMGAVE